MEEKEVNEAADVPLEGGTDIYVVNKEGILQQKSEGYWLEVDNNK